MRVYITLAIKLKYVEGIFTRFSFEINFFIKSIYLTFRKCINRSLL